MTSPADKEARFNAKVAAHLAKRAAEKGPASTEAFLLARLREREVGETPEPACNGGVDLEA